MDNHRQDINHSNAMYTNQYGLCTKFGTCVTPFRGSTQSSKKTSIFSNRGLKVTLTKEVLSKSRTPKKGISLSSSLTKNMDRLYGGVEFEKKDQAIKQRNRLKQVSIIKKLEEPSIKESQSKQFLSVLESKRFMAQSCMEDYFGQFQIGQKQLRQKQTYQSENRSLKQHSYANSQICKNDTEIVRNLKYGQIHQSFYIP